MKERALKIYGVCLKAMAKPGSLIEKHLTQGLQKLRVPAKVAGVVGTWTVLLAGGGFFALGATAALIGVLAIPATLMGTFAMNACLVLNGVGAVGLLAGAGLMRSVLYPSLTAEPAKPQAPARSAPALDRATTAEFKKAAEETKPVAEEKPPVPVSARCLNKKI